MAGLFSGMFGNSSGGIAHGANGATALPAPGATNPVNGEQNKLPAGASNTDPNAGNTGTGNAEGSSLDALTKFWDTPKDADGKPVVPGADPLAQTVFNFDHAKVVESAKSLNFTAGVNPELVTQALSGDAKAFLEVINQVSQSAFSAATINTGQMINQGTATNNGRIKASLPRSIKEVQLDQMPASNSVFQHPAAQPLVTALRKMAFAKDPNANPADINESVEALLGGLSVAISDADPAKIEAKAKAVAGEADWSTFL